MKQAYQAKVKPADTGRFGNRDFHLILTAADGDETTYTVTVPGSRGENPYIYVDTGREVEPLSVGSYGAVDQRIAAGVLRDFCGVSNAAEVARVLQEGLSAKPTQAPGMRL